MVIYRAAISTKNKAEEDDKVPSIAYESHRWCIKDKEAETK